MKKIFLFLFTFVCTANITNASIFRAGEITYHFVSGLTYEFTLVTYTNIFSNPLEVIECGDGSWDTLSLSNVISLSNGIRKNEYLGFHTYPGVGTYIISLEGSNRIDGIINIPNSINVPFFISATIFITPFLGENNSTVLNNFSIDSAFVGQPFIYNPIAFDMDGDSLVYIIDTCKGEDGLDIPGYYMPSEVTIDAQTGDFIWNSPLMLGTYNFAIRIEEYRNGVFIGNVLQELQIIVTSGTGIYNNNYTMDKIKFFPNPFTNSTTLQTTKPLQNATLSIYDILGKVVKSYNNLTGTEINISCDGMKRGMYFFSLLDAKGFIGNGKLIIE